MVFELLKGLFGGRSRVSPQGWSDAEQGFPASATRRGRFRSPWEAVDAVETAIETLVGCKKALLAASQPQAAIIERGQLSMEVLVEAMQALYICDSDMAPRKGSYGRLAKLLQEHLAEVPELLEQYPTGSQISHLAEDLGDSGDRDLAEEGRLLTAVLDGLKKGS